MQQMHLKLATFGQYGVQCMVLSRSDFHEHIIVKSVSNDMRICLIPTQKKDTKHLAIQ